MTNYEHFKDWFEENKFEVMCNSFCVSGDGVPRFCNARCNTCGFAFSSNCTESRMEWLVAEYKEIDWSKVPIDTKVEVLYGSKFSPRYFAGVDYNGYPMVFKFGATSFSATEDEYGDGKYTTITDTRSIRLYNGETNEE